jgi:hypothetical protein
MMGVSFTIAAGPRQRSHSQVRVSLDSWPHFTVADSRLPQPGGPGPRIYTPQEQGDLVMPPGTGFPFRRLLRLAGLRWRYSTPPPHGITLRLVASRSSVSCNNAFTYHSPPIFRWIRQLPLPSKNIILKMAIAMLTEALENLKYSVRRNPESRSHILLNLI